MWRKNLKPSYTDLGYADKMGPKLRTLVEKQLSDDLGFYGLIASEFKFDWSECCIEGDDANYLDGVVENFSGINIFDEKDKHIAAGWMEFIYEPKYNFFICYWEFLAHFNLEKEIDIKDKVGIPLHIFNKIPINIRFKYEKELITEG